MNRKRLNIFLGITIALSFFSFSIREEGAELSAKSAKCIKDITKIIKTYKEEGENLSDRDVQASILADVSELYPLEPKGKVNKTTIKEIAQLVREKVAVEFPDKLEDVKKKAEEEADKIFSMSKKLDYVKIRYKRGGKIYELKGVFYSYGGNSINVGGNTIAIFDLLPEDRIKFDKAYCDREKKTYIQEKISDYYKRKSVFSNKIYNEMLVKIKKENEDAGYIYAWLDWRTPRNLTEILIREIQKEKKTTAPQQVDIDTEKNKEDTAATETEKTSETKDKTETAETKMKTVKKKAEEKLIRINSTYVGIDADQGYQLAIWGMKHKDVNLLFPGQLEIDSKKEIEIINYNSGPLSRVELHFFHDSFYKVALKFRIGPNEGMYALWNQLKERYGSTDEEKEMEKSQQESGSTEENKKENNEGGEIETFYSRFMRICKGNPENCIYKEGEDTCLECGVRKACAHGNHEFKDGVCIHCGAKEESETEIEQVQVYHWTGKITIGTLTVKLNDKKTAYTEFVFIKENPKIKEEILKKLEEENKRKAKEESKKAIEEYKKFNQF